MSTRYVGQRIKSWSSAPIMDAVKEWPPQFIYIFLPEVLYPLERIERYEEFLRPELEAAGLGEVIGGGTLLGDERDDGTRPILSCGIDVEAFDVVKARAWLRERMQALGCHEGTRIQYFDGDEPLEDEFDGSNWALAEPRPDLPHGY